MTRLLVFDLDGTLLETAPDLIAALNHVLSQEGIAPLEERIGRKFIGQGAAMLLRKGFEAQGVPLDDARLPELVNDFVAYYQEHIAEQTHPYPGLMDALAALKAAGWSFAVCTNKLEHLARKLFDALDLTDQFVAVTGGDTFAHKKPHPEHLLQTIALAGGTVENTIMVGDSISDINAAKAAGVPVIAVDFGYTPVPVSELGPDLVISHFDQFQTAVAQLSRHTA